MRKLLIAIAVLAMAGRSVATTTVAGNLRNLGTGTSSGFVRFWLRGCGGNQPRANNVAVIAPTQGGTYYFDIPAVNGAVNGTLYSTRAADGIAAGELSCGGSFNIWYGMQVSTNGKFGPEIPIAAKNGVTLDPSNVTPINVNPVITAPTGDNTYFRLDAGNTPVTGRVQFNLGMDLPEIAKPANPPATTCRLYNDNSNHKLTAIDSNGQPCFPVSSGGSGTTIPAGVTNFPVIYKDGTNAIVGAGTGWSDDGANVTMVEPLRAPNITVANLNGVRVVEGVTYTTIAQVLAALPSTGAFIIRLPTGYRETFTSHYDLGNGTTKTVFLQMDSDVILTCNVTDTTYCFKVHDGSGIIGIRNQSLTAGRGDGSVISIASTANVANVVQTGESPQAALTLQGFVIDNVNHGAVTNAFVNIVNLNNAHTIRDISGYYFPNIGMHISATTGGTQTIGPVNIDNCFFDGFGISGARPLVIESDGSGATNGVMVRGGMFIDPGSNLAAIDIEGNGGTTGTLRDILISEVYTQQFTGTTTVTGIKIVDAAGVIIQGGEFQLTDATTGHTGISINQSGSGRTHAIKVENFRFSGGSSNKGLNNIITSETILTSTGNVLDYTYQGTTGTQLPSAAIIGGDTTLSIAGGLDATAATLWRGHTTAQANPNSPQINCSVGEEIFSTGSTNGQNKWYCTATNTWTQQLNSGAAGMSTSAGNASGVAVPTDWSPSGTGGQNLGATLHPWGNLFIGAAATNNIKLTGTATAARSATFPDNTGNVAETNFAQSFTATQNFTKLVSNSANAATTGFLNFGTGDTATYWNSGLSQTLNLISSGGTGPVPVGDSPGISIGPLLTGQVAGTGITIQPLAATGNNNGGDLSLISGTETGAGRHGDVIINAGIDGVVQALTGFGFPVVNNPTTAHPIINDIASYSAGQAILTPHGSTLNLAGVCIRNCANSGSGIFVRNGLADLNLDNAGTAGDLVYISQTTDGFGTDVAVGSAPISQYIGRVVSNISGTLYQVDVCIGCESFASAAAGAVALAPGANQTIQGTGAAIVGLVNKCPAGAASTVACMQVVDNTGANIFKPQQNGQITIGNGSVTGTMQLGGVLGPNATPASAGLVRNSDTDIAMAWRNHANSGDVALSKDTNDVVTLSGIFRSLQGQFTNGVIDLTEATAPSAIAAHDVCYADSTAHAIKCSLNNGSFLTNAFLDGDLGGTAAAAIVSKVNGTSVPTNSAADQFLGTTASATGAWAAVPNCGDASHGLAYNTSTHAFSCQNITGSAGGVADPGGNGFMSRTALNTSINRTLTGTASQITITNGTGVSGDPVFSLDTTHVLTDTNTITKTGLTVDAEGSGNVMTRPFYVEFTPGCNNATASQGAFDVPTSGAATFSCFGTTTTQGAADFVDASTTTLTGHFTLPQGWVGNMDARISWFGGSATANSVRYALASGCVADSESVNTGPSYNAATNLTSTYTGTANQRKTNAFSAIAMTNCSAGEVMYFQLQRLGADGADTYAATAEVISLQFEGRTTK